MCQILGLAQSWWSVAGLTVDIVGFSMLSIDLMREYGRARNVEELRAGANAMERLSASEQDELVEDYAFKGDDDGSLAAKLERVNARNRMLIDRATALIAADKLGAMVIDENGSGRWTIGPDDVRAKADEMAAKPYRRGPIRFGIFLVILGFIGQLAGAAPC